MMWLLLLFPCCDCWPNEKVDLLILLFLVFLSFSLGGEWWFKHYFWIWKVGHVFETFVSSSLWLRKFLFHSFISSCCFNFFKLYCYLFLDDDFKRRWCIPWTILLYLQIIQCIWISWQALSKLLAAEEHFYLKEWFSLRNRYIVCLFARIVDIKNLDDCCFQ